MKDLVKQLEAIGFTNYESKVFMTLMQGHNMTAAEIAKDAKIPRTSVYDILKSFTQKGICNEIDTPSKLRYEMIDPDVVEDKLKNGFKKSFDEKLTELDSSFKTLKSFYKKKAQKDSFEKIELLRGFNKHRHIKFLKLFEKAKKEILVANKLPDRIYDKVDEQAEKFFKQGGVLKSIYQLGSNIKIKYDHGWEDLSKDGIIDLFKKMELNGVQVRLTNSLPQNLFIFDRKYVFLNILDESLDKNNLSDLIIDNEQYATAMKDLFDYYWDRSMTISEFEKTTK
jgi:sugar-specific transcriptional regulator TrmB